MVYPLLQEVGTLVQRHGTGCTGDGSLSRDTTSCSGGHHPLEQGTPHVHRRGIVSIENKNVSDKPPWSQKADWWSLYSLKWGLDTRNTLFQSFTAMPTFTKKEFILSIYATVTTESIIQQCIWRTIYIPLIVEIYETQVRWMRTTRGAMNANDRNRNNQSWTATNGGLYSHHSGKQLAASRIH